MRHANSCRTGKLVRRVCSFVVSENRYIRSVSASSDRKWASKVMTWANSFRKHRFSFVSEKCLLTCAGKGKGVAQLA